MRPPDPRAIASRQNAFVDALRDVREESATGEWLFLEGPRLLEEALQSGLTIDRLAFVPALFETELIQRAIPKARETVQLTPYVFKAISDVEAPQGIVVVARKPIHTWETLFRRLPAPIVILDGLQDPGNAATIARTAEAAGAAGLVTTPGTVRFFSPKALRGAMGSSLRLPVLEHEAIPKIIEQLKMKSVQLVGTGGAAGGMVYTELNWKQPLALIFGQEGGGLSKEWPAEALFMIHIPMHPPVESLNVAAAAAVLLYEWRRSQ